MTTMKLELLSSEDTCAKYRGWSSTKSIRDFGDRFVSEKNKKGNQWDEESDYYSVGIVRGSRYIFD